MNRARRDLCGGDSEMGIPTAMRGATNELQNNRMINWNPLSRALVLLMILALVDGCAVYHRSTMMSPICEKCNDNYISPSGHSYGEFRLIGMIIPVIPTWKTPERGKFFLRLQNYKMRCPEIIINSDTINGKNIGNQSDYPKCEYRHLPPIDSGTIIMDTTQIKIKWEIYRYRFFSPMITV